jgi:hypothetical protein
VAKKTSPKKVARSKKAATEDLARFANSMVIHWTGGDDPIPRKGGQLARREALKAKHGKTVLAYLNKDGSVQALLNCVKDGTVELKRKGT